ncbi:hypothetical protein ACFWY5_25390 [Nonomuraea sp. NPDC059007]|uniref:TRADD-N-associated membrane domain-containing protein n=1 Tax=Nonomuraea sp. NPDC059007 TaxID=3346692 RepID=UPI003677B617
MSLDDNQGQDGWSRSPERRRARLLGSLAIILGVLWAAAVAWMITLWAVYLEGNAQAFIDIIGVLLAPSVIFLVGIIALIYAGQAQRQRFEDRSRENRRDVQLGSREAELIGQDDSYLSELWKITNERLRGYHNRADQHAEQSFRYARWAILGGFVIIVGTAGIAAWKTLSTPSSIVVGIVGTAGAVLAAYIGRTFLRLQETTAQHLRSYFAQPQETFRFLVAQRLIRELNEDQRPRAVAQLIDSIARSDATAPLQPTEGTDQAEKDAGK